MTRPDPLLSQLLSDAADNPCGDPLPLMALTDFLSEQPPTPVQGLYLPRWLERAWFRSRREAIARGTERRGPWGGLDATLAILNDLEQWFCKQGLPACWYLRHHGLTEVGGLPCFATEPTASAEVARAQAACLSARLKCVGVVLLEGRWGKGVVRVLLLPTPNQFTP